MASSDAHTAGVLIWNPGSYERRYDVHLRDLGFSSGRVRVYRIDKEHASPNDGVADTLDPVATHELSKHDWSWIDGRIPPHAVMYFEADDGSGESELETVDIAETVRINRYYPARGRTRSYADFDRRTWTARLGMANNETADERIGVPANNLPAALEVVVRVDGGLRKLSADSLLGVRLDYRTADGWAKSILFHGPCAGVDLYDETGRPATTWGLPGRLDEVVAVDDLARFEIEVARQAPPGWSGAAHLSFYLRAAGRGTRAKLTVRPARP